MADPKKPADAPPPPKRSEKIIPVLVEDEMKDSFLNYSVSVLMDRAIPDVRDGLKPSQRRILYAMNELGLGRGAKTKKCATIVGETMGKYHPHGDQAIYPTLVRLAQDFATRYLLIQGQGNFGTVDGDPPAAMRYTEARMTEFASNMLEDLDKKTVDFKPNFDESLEEPVVLPSKFPNLLCNGSVGIAVGMATSIPPHNLAEICDALMMLIEKPDASMSDVLQIVKGPDFPTGGVICGAGGIRQAYETGRGRLTVRGKVHIEEQRGKKVIVLDEIPYYVNKADLIKRIAELVKEDQIAGIDDISDLSSKDGTRVEVWVKKGEDEDVILNQLYSKTSLQETFSIIMIALVGNRPQMLSLKDMLQAYIDHRKEVIRRRTRFLLQEAEREAHILEGLVKALDLIDEIIALIKKSESPAVAKAGLIDRWQFTEIQADAILRMTLAKLTGLEREKLKAELADLHRKIAEYRAILADVKLIFAIIRKDLEELRARSDKRRTEIQAAEAETFEKADLIAEEDMVVVMSHLGYIKRVPLASYRKQKRGGKGIIGADTKEQDFIERLFIASTHAYLMFFTETGKCYWKKVYDLPQLERTARGKPLLTLLGLKETERITAVVSVKSYEKGFLVMATERGLIKKTELAAYGNPRPSGLIAINLEEKDRLIGVATTSGANEIVLGTAEGMSIRFSEEDLRPMGRATYGVNGIDLDDGDRVVDMIVPEAGQTILTGCEQGYGKRSAIDEYRLQSRSGKGVINIRTTVRNGKVIGIKAVRDEDGVIMITQGGIVVRIAVKDIRSMGRATQGVRLIRLDEGDKLTSIARVEAEEDDGNVKTVPVPVDDEPSPPQA